MPERTTPPANRRRPTANVAPQGNNWVDPPVGLRSMTVELGDESYSPIEYQAMHTGKLVATIELADGQDPEVALKQVFDWLEQQRERQFEEQLIKFLRRVKMADETARISAERDKRDGAQTS